MGVAFSGDAAKFPDVRFIWSHAGGSGRRRGAHRGRVGQREGLGCRTALWRRSGSSTTTSLAHNRGAVASLLELVKSSQILLHAFPPGGSATDYVKALSEMRLLL